MKTKNKLFLFAAAFLSLSVFFVRVDGIQKTAKAMDCYELCADEIDMQGCYDDCAISNDGATSWTDTGTTTDTYTDGNTSTGDALYTQQMCDAYYGTGYVVNSDRTGCEIREGTGGVTQADCDSYNNGYVLNTAGTDCVLPQGNSDYQSCISEGNGVEYCARFDNTLCTTNAGCINSGLGISCDQSTRRCSASASNGDTASGDVCYTDSWCNWYSRCKLGDRGATGICQGYLNPSDPQPEIARLLNIPADSTISSTGLITNSNGTTQQLTPAQLAQVQGLTVAQPVPAYFTTPAGPKCGTGFQDVGGVCFPTNTGLSSASISDILMSLFGWLMGLFTTFAVLAFVISGIQYFMASGDESMAEKAKENATHAVIGIIIGLSGFIIIKAIAAALSGTSILF